ncbi:MAG: hypothetical protein ACPGVH_07110, partial [Chitinophagales bacterium]
PNRIITIGEYAKIAIQKILINKSEINNKSLYYYNHPESQIEMFFIPHISNMVLQNLIPIANLFLSIGKLKNNEVFKEIGNSILIEKENLFK